MGSSVLRCDERADSPQGNEKLQSETQLRLLAATQSEAALRDVLERIEEGSRCEICAGMMLRPCVCAHLSYSRLTYSDLLIL